MFIRYAAIVVSIFCSLSFSLPAFGQLAHVLTRVLPMSLLNDGTAGWQHACVCMCVCVVSLSFAACARDVT